MDISQIFIMIFGCSAIWVVGRKEQWRRWGYILGMCSQPFWLYSTFQAEQWGIFALCWWYTYSWGQGIWNYWLSQDDKTTADIVLSDADIKYQIGRLERTIDLIDAGKDHMAVAKLLADISLFKGLLGETEDEQAT